MEEKLEALVGIHNILVGRSIGARLRRNYNVTIVSIMDELRKALGITDSCSPATTCTYSVVIMDVNLESPGAHTFEQGRMVYNYLKPLTENGTVHFTTVTGNLSLVQGALDNGIPCVDKPNGINQYLKSLQQ